MDPKAPTDTHPIDEKVEEVVNHLLINDLDDEEFGGPEERSRIEKRLLWKLDCRMSILVVIYVLNFVRDLFNSSSRQTYREFRLTEIMPREWSLAIITRSRNEFDTLARAARLRGFEQDLHLKGQEFNTLLSILYVGYILMQIPSYVSKSTSVKINFRLTRHSSNIFLNRIARPSLYLPVCMIIWGIISILTGKFRCNRFQTTVSE